MNKTLKTTQMIQPASKAEEIKERLKRNTVYLDKPEDIATIEKMNQQLQRSRREYQDKEFQSIEFASRAVLYS